MWAKPTVSGRWAVAHDADGWATYDWDVDEALLRVIPQGGSTVAGQANEFYDAAMKRVARELDGTATYYVFDGEKIARVEQPEAGTRDFYVQEGQSIYSPLVSVHDEAAEAQYWYLFDALGSTMGLVDAYGNLSGKLQYDAFGNVLEEENVPRSAFFKYVGAYQYMPEDFEDMMLLWHRWYDPTAGRFVGRDSYIRDTERYAYCHGAPLGYMDADGEVSLIAICIVVGGAALIGIAGCGKPPKKKPSPPKPPLPPAVPHPSDQRVTNLVDSLPQCLHFQNMLAYKRAGKAHKCGEVPQDAKFECCNAIWNTPWTVGAPNPTQTQTGDQAMFMDWCDKFLDEVYDRAGRPPGHGGP